MEGQGQPQVGHMVQPQVGHKDKFRLDKRTTNVGQMVQPQVGHMVQPQVGDMVQPQVGHKHNPGWEGVDLGLTRTEPCNSCQG